MLALTYAPVCVRSYRLSALQHTAQTHPRTTRRICVAYNFKVLCMFSNRSVISTLSCLFHSSSLSVMIKVFHFLKHVFTYLTYSVYHVLCFTLSVLSFPLPLPYFASYFPDFFDLLPGPSYHVNKHHRVVFHNVLSRYASISAVLKIVFDKTSPCLTLLYSSTSVVLEQ